MKLCIIGIHNFKPVKADKMYRGFFFEPVTLVLYKCTKCNATTTDTVVGHHTLKDLS